VLVEFNLGFCETSSLRGNNDAHWPFLIGEFLLKVTHVDVGAHQFIPIVQNLESVFHFSQHDL